MEKHREDFAKTMWLKGYTYETLANAAGVILSTMQNRIASGRYDLRWLAQFPEQDLPPVQKFILELRAHKMNITKLAPLLGKEPHCMKRYISKPEGMKAARAILERIKESGVTLEENVRKKNKAKPQVYAWEKAYTNNSGFNPILHWRERL